MLVLSRRQNESVVISDDIVVTVVKIRGNQVHLAFDAPRDTPIHRREVYEAIAREEADERMELRSVAVS
jgi:carbon storage regulator